MRAPPAPPGTNLTPAAPGSFQSLYLAVPDIDAARDEIVGRGIEVSEVFHEPDGNGWLLQEITTRLPGR